MASLMFELLALVATTLLGGVCFCLMVACVAVSFEGGW